MSIWPRIIVHADMDAFYAAVEQLDDPELRGKAILVGPNRQRGVVLTASYEARPYGVGSAMPVVEARRRCPHAIMVAPRFERYKEISEQVMNVFGDFAAAIEPISLDEAFLDMSGSEHIFGSPRDMGRKIKNAVYDATGLHISVGVSATKYVAKVASAHEKPNGLTVIPPEDAVKWLAPLPVNRLWGVGKVTNAKLNAIGLQTIGDIAIMQESELRRRLGTSGMHFYKLANGIDERPVSRGRAAKSIGSDRTLSEDVSAKAEIEIHLRRAAERIARRVRSKQYVAKGVRVRLKTNRFEMLTRQSRLPHASDTAECFLAAASRLLDEFDHPGPFRLVGMTVYDLDWRKESAQPDLFDSQSARKLETIVDQLADRFGKGVVVRATDLAQKGTIADDDVNLDFMDYRDGERVSRPG
ncbi:MAG: DNA polymerase IV [Pseudomonadota bacterium]